MTMTNKKRDRKIGSAKSPQPSPNTRENKQQRSAELERKNKQNEEEMIDSQENAIPTDLINKFDKATTADWKRWLTQNETTGWEVLSLPEPTPTWKALSAFKKESQGLSKSDLLVTKWPLVLKDGWKDIKALYNVEQSTPFGDRLSDDLLRDKETMFGKKHVKAFKCMIALSQTQASNLPLVKTAENGLTFVPSTVIAELWVASINIFGCTIATEKKLTTVFSDDEAITTPSQAWKDRDTALLVGYKKETLYAEGDDGAHDTCRKIKNHFLQSGHQQQHWKKLFLEISTKKDLNKMENTAIRLAMRLAKTDPKILDGWQGDLLVENDITAAWSGAYHLFGGVWNSGVKFDTKTASVLKQPKYQPNPTPTNTSEVNLAEPAKPPEVKRTAYNPYYVVKQAPRAPKGKSPKTLWTQVTYLKLKTSSYWNKQISTYPEALTNVLTEWASVVDLLCSIDPKCTAVLAWSDRDFGRAPLKQKSTKPLTKEGVGNVYTDEFFLSSRQGGQFFRFRLGHTKPIEFYLESSKMENGLTEDSALYVDKIQDSHVSIAGWGAGSVVGRGTLEDTKEMLKNHPLFTSNQIKYIEVRVQQVRLKNGRWIKGEARPLAVHFFVRSRDTAKARKVLNAIYPSMPRKEYPGGVQWRFVTNVADPYFPKTPKSMKKAERLRAKQEQFNREIDSVSTQNIKNLYHCLSVAPFVTLAQVLMNWRSAKDPDQRLYLHVEQTYEETKLFYHSSVADEASHLAPFLPIILEQEYGPRAWNWFEDRAKDYLGGYIYDLDQHKIIMKDEDINEDVDKHWDQSMGTADLDFNDEEDEDNGLVIDIGLIVIDATDRQRILDDESIASMKSSAEALWNAPKGWNPSPDEVMKDAEKPPPATPSTLSSQDFDVNQMTQTELEKFMKLAAEKLKSANVTPTTEGGVGN